MAAAGGLCRGYDHRGAELKHMPKEVPSPDEWSHPWHDQLGLFYRRAIAEKLSRQPELLKVAIDNLIRWRDLEPSEQPSKARSQWQLLLESQDLPQIIAKMADPSEEGNRRRQSTPFAGFLTREEKHKIRDQLLKESNNSP